MKTVSLLICLVVAVASAAGSQDVVGDFTRSPTEHIINEIDHPFVVRSVAGVVLFKGSNDPLAEVLFEIQGPGTDRKIRRCETDKGGRFRIRRVPRGTYRFKATLDGFQSVMGTIVVSAKAEKANTIAIELPVGV